MGNYATWKMLDGLNVTFPFLYATLVLDIFPPVFDPAIDKMRGGYKLYGVMSQIPNRQILIFSLKFELSQ